jgi:hypothetical protein
MIRQARPTERVRLPAFTALLLNPLDIPPTSPYDSIYSAVIVIAICKTLPSHFDSLSLESDANAKINTKVL